jgi:hypothetical protein
MPEKLDPPDLDRCQAIFREGSFMTLGPRTWDRCVNVPTVVATEVKPPKGSDLRGSMSLCDECAEHLKKQGPAVEFKKIEVKRTVAQ